MCVNVISEFRPMSQFPRPATEPPIFSEGFFQETAKRHAHFHLLDSISPLRFGVICLIHHGIGLVATCPEVWLPLWGIWQKPNSALMIHSANISMSLMFLCEFSQRCKYTGGIICCLWPPSLPSMPQCQRPSWRTTSLNLVPHRSGRVNGTAKAFCQDLHLRLFSSPLKF